MTKTVKSQNTISVAPVIVPQPLKRDFKTIVVIGSNASIMAEPVWREKLGLKEGEQPERKTLRKQLRALGLQMTEVFDKDAMEAAKKAHRDSLSAQRRHNKESAIQVAFEKAGAPFNQRVASALKLLLPTFRNKTPEQTATALSKIVGIVS